MDKKLVELKAFVKFLKTDCGFDFDINSFNHRLMLQKYVLIAKSVGWDNDYLYNMYIRGPYSSELADDYYRLQNVQISDSDYTDTLQTFDKEAFKTIIYNKNIKWLEVGATLLSLYKNNKAKKARGELIRFVIKRATEIKSNYDPKFIIDVFYELGQYGLLRDN